MGVLYLSFKNIKQHSTQYTAFVQSNTFWEPNEICEKWDYSVKTENWDYFFPYHLHRLGISNYKDLKC